MVDIQIKGPRMDYKLTLKSKFTILSGKSATGKSYLHRLLSDEDMLAACDVSISDSRYEFIYGYKVYDVRDDGDHIDGYWIYLVDDDDSEYGRVFQQWIAVSRNTYYVIATRNVHIPNVDYGLEDIYEFTTAGKMNVLVPKFSYDVYKQSLRVLPKEAKIISEDSTTGKEFYAKLFNNNEVLYVNNNGVVSGKDYLLTFLERLSNSGVRDVFVCADWCSFGPYAGKLEKWIRSVRLPHVILLPNALSFEYVLLCSNFFNYTDIEQGLLSSRSTESYYEDVLSELTRDSQLQMIHGTTKRLPACYYEKCCVIKNNEYYRRFGDCTSFLKGDDKFFAMFWGTEFESLLILSGRL